MDETAQDQNVFNGHFPPYYPPQEAHRCSGSHRNNWLVGIIMIMLFFNIIIDTFGVLQLNSIDNDLNSMIPPENYQTSSVVIPGQ